MTSAGFRRIRHNGVCWSDRDGGAGSLTAADLPVFYSLDYSMSNFEQAKARINRVGPSLAPTFYLVTSGTVDESASGANNKTDLARILIDEYGRVRTRFKPNKRRRNNAI